MPALGTKLRVPRSRRTLLRRSRLPNPFAPDAAAWPRLVIIAAPPGFGKTTLLAQWLTFPVAGSEDTPPEAGRAPRVAWVSLDESDADPQQFLLSLTESLRQAGDGVGADARAMLANDRAIPVEDVVASVANDLDLLVGPTVIALDDFHRTGGPPVHEAVGFLLDNLPPHVTIAITTRADPPLPLARLRARGELVEIRAADLRFTRDESDAFLRTVMGLDLEPAHVDALESRTEGWVAGLQLAALSARSRNPSGSAQSIGEFVDAFSGTHRFVVDYLVEEVLDAEPEDGRRFLLLTSVLDHLSGPLCDALTGLGDGQLRLEDLERRNVFLVALDDQRRWYRFHQLFADALRARLPAEYPDRTPGLHRAASRWYAAQGLLDDALRHASLAGDADEDVAWLVDLVEYALPGLRQGRRDRAIIRWLATVPDAVAAERPGLATARAWSRLAEGDLPGAAEWLDIAERRLGDRPPRSARPDVPAPLIAAWLDEQRMTPAAVAIYRAALAQAAGDTDATVRHARDAERAARQTDHFVRGSAAGFIGLAAWASGDLGAGVATFRRAVAELGAAGNVTDQLGATVVLANMALASGRPDEARRLYESALASAQSHPAAAAAIAGDLHVGLSDVLREQGDLDAAAGHLQAAQELGDTASLPENRFRRPATRAGLLVATGEFDAALEELDSALALYRPGYFPDTRPLAAAKARVLVLAGRLDEARRWATASGVDAAEPTYLREYDQLTHARLVIAEHRAGVSDATGELAATAAILARIVEAARSANRPGSVIEARIVLALASAAAGDLGRAQTALGQAVAAGVPAGYCRLFLDEGPPMDALLRSCLTTGDQATAALVRQLLGRPTATPAATASGHEALSEREREVLALLASEASGPEIAAQLFVSVNTLRTHTKHIFTKLGVQTRRAAVRRAGELGLL